MSWFDTALMGLTTRSYLDSRQLIDMRHNPKDRSFVRERIRDVRPHLVDQTENALLAKGVEPLMCFDMN